MAGIYPGKIPNKIGGVARAKGTYAPSWNAGELADAAIDTTTGRLLVDATGGTGTGASQVQGTAADGAAAVGNPVQIGGVDGSGNAQAMLTDTSGRLEIVGALAAGGTGAPGTNPVLIGGASLSGGNPAQVVGISGVLGGIFVAGKTASGSALSENPILIGGSDGTNVYRLLTDGTGQAQVVVAGLLKGSATTYSPTAFQNLGANPTLNVKASVGNVFSVSCYNANAAARFFQLWNSATDATAGSLKLSFLVPAGGQIVIGEDFFTESGINFSTGIAFGYSTTANTYTAATAGEQTSFVNFK